MDGAQIRKTVLEVVNELAKNGTSLQSISILQHSANRLGIKGIEEEQALLTFFDDLFRTGFLAWGYNLSNPAPPFCHITDRGRAVLASLNRDPSNPDGYLASLRACGSVSPIAESYIREALSTYAAGCYKATAVMVGAAAENVALELRDTLGARLDALGKSCLPNLNDWRIKRILDALEGFLTTQKKSMPRPLFEMFESYWPAFTQQIRIARNAAGHPTSVDPIQEDAVQASLLIFPELIALSTGIGTWISNDYK